MHSMANLVVVLLGQLSGADRAVEAALPRVSVRPIVPVFQSARHVAIEVTVNNSEGGCRPLLIDHALSPYPSELRPATVLQLEVTDEAGKRVAAAREFGATRRGFVPLDLMILNCGALHGWTVPLGSFDWEHVFRPGLYNLRVRLENRVRAFFDRDQQRLPRFVAASGLEEREALDLMRDFSAVSPEVRFEVRQH